MELRRALGLLPLALLFLAWELAVHFKVYPPVLLADRILVFTPRPGRIAADFKVDLPRPRASQSAEFSALARELRGLIGADRDFD